MAGGVCLDQEGVVYLNLGCKAEAGEVDDLTEIPGSEYEAVRQRVLNQRKAA